MTDLVAFLRARLDEDERIARDGEGACWHVDYCDEDGPVFMARFDPARVLREVEAKRRIVGWADSPALPDAEYFYVLTALALPYADHGDHREEWRP